MYGIRDRYTDRDHNGSGALRALQELYSSRVTFEKDVAAIIRSLNGEPANSLKDYRKFGSFLQTALVHFVQMTQTSYNATQTSYNATQTSYNLTSHNIRIHSYIIYIISMSAPNAIMLDARRTYPSAVRPSAERASLRQQRTICHISEHTKKQMM